MRFFLSMAVLAAAAMLAPGAMAREKIARCDIASSAGNYRGPCRFEAAANGSFSLSAPGKRSLLREVGVISVEVVSPGVAEVRGLTSQGINSRWGGARRSRADRACWEGEDFRICAY